MAIRALAPKIHSDPLPVQRAADRKVGQFAQSVFDALERIRASVSLSELGQNFGRVEPDWSMFWGMLKAPDAQTVYLTTLVAGANSEPLNAQLEGSLTLTNPAAVDIARREAARLVSGLSAESREAVRLVTAQSLDGQWTVKQAARLYRDVIGLTPDRAQAVLSVRRGLEQVAAGEMLPEALRGDFALLGRIGRNFSPEMIDARVSKYAQRQLADRAMTVARTETMRAAHQGQHEVWRQARAEGLIPADVQRVWVTTPDDRLCPECASMDGQVVSMDGQFSSEKNTAEEPPIHPNCRCTTSLDV